MEDNVTGTSGSDMRALWAIVGTVDFTLSEMGAIRGL